MAKPSIKLGRRQRREGKARGPAWGSEHLSREWRESLEEAIRERVRELIKSVAGEELAEALGAGRSERTPLRHGYRHGAKPRQLSLRSGTAHLEVPRARLVDADGQEGGVEWQGTLVPRYRRSTPKVEQTVLGVYLSGGNTRRIRTALSPLLAGGRCPRAPCRGWKGVSSSGRGGAWPKRRSSISTWT